MDLDLVLSTILVVFFGIAIFLYGGGALVILVKLFQKKVTCCRLGLHDWPDWPNCEALSNQSVMIRKCSKCGKNQYRDRRQPS